jgi:hypothetical protein
MARWIGITLLAALLAGCGIDQGKLAASSDAARTTTTTTAPSGTTGPGHTTEPSQRASAEDLLLDQSDLGTEWIRTDAGAASANPIPDCAQTTSGAGPDDEAQAVYVQGVRGAALVQHVAVYGTTEQAHQAVVQFRSGLDACDKAVVDVQELPVPRVGDETDAARIELGGLVIGQPIDLACVRVKQRVTCLTLIALRAGTDQFPTLVKAAAVKLG